MVFSLFWWHHGMMKTSLFYPSSQGTIGKLYDTIISLAFSKNDKSKPRIFPGHPASEWALATKAPSTPKAPISFSITAIWRVRVSHVVPMIPRLQNSLRPLKRTLWYEFLSIFRRVHPGSIPKYVGCEAPWPLLRCTTISTVLGHPDPALAFFQCSVESCLGQVKCQEENK